MKLKNAAFVVVFLFIIGCGARLTPEEKRQMEIVRELSSHMQSLRPNIETLYSVEPLCDGYAIIVKQTVPESNAVTSSPKYAYWSREGTIYAVNEAATKSSPDLPLAPEEITYESVCKATKEQP